MDCLNRDPRLTRKVAISHQSSVSTETHSTLYLSSGEKGVHVIEGERGYVRTPMYLTLTKDEARELGEQLLAHANAY